jgi:DNA-binding transcriptional MerR regulator
MPLVTNNRKYYRTCEVYRMVGISRNTLFNWLQRGILGEKELRDRRGWRLFTESDVETLKNEASRIVTVDRRKS